jgi:hypothetical protein
MTQELRIEMRQRARRLKGLLNLLADDIYHVNADAGDFDLLCLGESINDTKNTLQMLIDGTTELEYTLYLSNQKHSRN